MGKGRCKAGIQRCRDGKWGACEGALLPRQERCNGIDDDCDGRVDEAFANKGKRCVIKDGACRFQGRWTCHRSGRKLRCGNAKTYLGRGRPIKIRMTPSRVRFRLRVGGVNYRARRQFCVGGRAGQKLTISASGYQLCVASLRGRSMRLKMKVKSEIEDAPGYCVR